MTCSQRWSNGSYVLYHHHSLLQGEVLSCCRYVLYCGLQEFECTSPRTHPSVNGFQNWPSGLHTNTANKDQGKGKQVHEYLDD